MARAAVTVSVRYAPPTNRLCGTRKLIDGFRTVDFRLRAAEQKPRPGEARHRRPLPYPAAVPDPRLRRARSPRGPAMRAISSRVPTGAAPSSSARVRRCSGRSQWSPWKIRRGMPSCAANACSSSKDVSDTRCDQWLNGSPVSGTRAADRPVRPSTRSVGFDILVLRPARLRPVIQRGSPQWRTATVTAGSTGPRAGSSDVESGRSGPERSRGRRRRRRDPGRTAEARRGPHHQSGALVRLRRGTRQTARRGTE